MTDDFLPRVYVNQYSMPIFLYSPSIPKCNIYFCQDYLTIIIRTYHICINIFFDIFLNNFYFILFYSKGDPGNKGLKGLVGDTGDLVCICCMLNETNKGIRKNRTNERKSESANDGSTEGRTKDHEVMQS